MTDDIDRPIKRKEKRSMNKETGYFDKVKEYGDELMDKAKDYVGFSGRNRKKKTDKALKRAGG
jgi:hypothetical protein